MNKNLYQTQTKCETSRFCHTEEEKERMKERQFDGINDESITSSQCDFSLPIISVEYSISHWSMHTVHSTEHIETPNARTNCVMFHK